MKAQRAEWSNNSRLIRQLRATNTMFAVATATLPPKIGHDLCRCCCGRTVLRTLDVPDAVPEASLSQKYSQQKGASPAHGLFHPPCTLTESASCPPRLLTGEASTGDPDPHTAQKTHRHRVEQHHPRVGPTAVEVHGATRRRARS